MVADQENINTSGFVTFCFDVVYLLHASLRVFREHFRLMPLEDVAERV